MNKSPQVHSREAGLSEIAAMILDRMRFFVDEEHKCAQTRRSLRDGLEHNGFEITDKQVTTAWEELFAAGLIKPCGYAQTTNGRRKRVFLVMPDDRFDDLHAAIKTREERYAELEEKENPKDLPF